MHWLFPDEQQARLLCEAGYSLRHDCQFHWSNRGYGSFEDFLAEMSSKKRKNIRQERKAVSAAGIEFAILHGGEIDRATWRYFYHAYRDTFARHGNIPPLNLDFFVELGHRLSDEVVLILGRHHRDPICAALCLRSDNALYGRYWGATAQLEHLHFETCYYQGIDYCIKNGIRHFEPGAQGEHKIARGFLPTITRSAHWLADEFMRTAIADFPQREREQVEAYRSLLNERSPFRRAQV